MLFDNVAKHDVSIPAKNKDEKPTTIGYLVNHIMDNLVQDTRKELFVKDGAM